MNNEINSILKLLTIIANSHGISIRKLNMMTDIPMEVIKKNLEYISSNYELYLIDLIPEEECDEESPDYMDVNWTIDGIPDGTTVLSLNFMERYLYKSLVTKDITSEDEYFGIKTKSTYKLEDYNYKLCQISVAISNNRALKVKYKSRKENVEEIIIQPLGIVFYEFENIFYVLGQYDEKVIAYRLDRILHIKETQDNFSPIAGFNIDDYLANMWGMEQGEPFKVKVKFIKVGNVAYKIRRDLECRKNKKLTEYEDHIVYEDTVVGINNFKSWLRTYGGAAVVLEPKELREQMIESAKRCLEYYT